MPNVNFTQLLCNHALLRNHGNCTYECRCGLSIRDSDIAALPEKRQRDLTTWIAYNFDHKQKRK